MKSIILPLLLTSMSLLMFSCSEDLIINDDELSTIDNDNFMKAS